LTFLEGATSFQVGLSQGLDVAGASGRGDPLISRPGAVPNFTKVAAEAHRIQSLVDNFSAAVNAYGQYAFDPLYAAEQFALGGGRVGRGYDPGELLGDHGVGGASELRFDWRPGVDLLSSVQLYGFFDIGKVWNRVGPITTGTSLASAGAGARIFFAEGYLIGLEAAQPLTRSPATESGQKPTRFFVDLSAQF